MAWALRAETHTSAVGSCLPGVSELGERVPGGLGHSILDAPVWAPASPPSPQPPSSCSLRSLRVSPCTCVVQDQPNVEGEFLHRLPGFPLCGSSLFCGCLPTKPSYLSPELWSLPHLSRRPSAICLGSTSPYCGLGNLSRRKVWVDVGLTLCVFPLKDRSCHCQFLSSQSLLNPFKSTPSKLLPWSLYEWQLHPSSCSGLKSWNHLWLFSSYSISHPSENPVGLLPNHILNLSTLHTFHCYLPGLSHQHLACLVYSNSLFTHWSGKSSHFH